MHTCFCSCCLSLLWEQIGMVPLLVWWLSPEIGPYRYRADKSTKFGMCLLYIPENDFGVGAQNYKFNKFCQIQDGVQNGRPDPLRPRV